MRWQIYFDSVNGDCNRCLIFTVYPCKPKGFSVCCTAHDATGCHWVHEWHSNGFKCYGQYSNFIIVIRLIVIVCVVLHWRRQLPVCLLHFHTTFGGCTAARYRPVAAIHTHIYTHYTNIVLELRSNFIFYYPPRSLSLSIAIYTMLCYYKQTTFGHHNV